ncbi:MAG: hypothetical protein KJ070_15895 [Verrucomicrobia bacterium]|nr:hypothetical protein [Verrucomicrobiota bacterium]
MKCQLLCGGLAAVLAAPALAATADFYVNDAVVVCPPQVAPQVDATNFVNKNFFSVNFTNLVFNTQLYRTANTLNFTNVSVMIANNGFQFDTGPSGAGQRRMAANFDNTGGTITAGSVDNTNVFFNFFFGVGLPKIVISATNVTMNSGTSTVGRNGLFSLTGRNVDLTRGNIRMEGFDDSLTAQNFFGSAFDGIFDGYWGIGTNLMNPAANFSVAPPTTPFHQVTSTAGALFTSLQLAGATTYPEAWQVGTNVFVQVVFLRNTNSAVLNNVYFPSAPFLGQIAVEWQGVHTNPLSGALLTNFLYLTDTFGTFASNSLLTTFNYYGQETFVPANYNFFRGGRLNFGTPDSPGQAGGFFLNTIATNEYSAYRAILAPTTVLPSSLPGPNAQLTNIPGRIEIAAEAVLDMTRARISGLNYLGIKATNHYAGSSRAQITVPWSDISLRSTNGSLVLTNLLTPEVSRMVGEVDLWSGRWTNNTANFQITYHVLFVDSRVAPTAPALVQDLTLRSTNAAGGSDSMVINDVFNVTRKLLLETQRLTIATNQLPAPAPVGELNLLSTQILWPAATPRLQYFTNWGGFNALNAVFFGGSRSSPYFTSNYNEPYLAFVNHGTVTTEGSLIWADYFENTGLFDTGLGFGSIELESQITRLTNGSFLALNGDISINTGELIVTNHVLQAGRRLTLNVRDLLTDTGVSNANVWAVGRGIHLPVKPAMGDLLGTTIEDTAPPAADVRHLWAAEDRGCVPEGFTNNAALGRLILDGGTNSQFTFTGAGVANAIYVDYIELRNFATNIDFFGNLTALEVSPNMRIYYGQVMADGISVAERLSGSHGGRLCWVADYAGIWSGTNVVYPDGTTNRFNTALVQSCNLDSDGDGLVNCVDPTPILRPQDIVLTVSVVGQPQLGAQLSWTTVPNSTNYVYYKTSLAGTDWQVLTNFVSGPVSAPVKVLDPLGGGPARYYRVRVDSYHP